MQRFAEEMLRKPTPAEEALAQILTRAGGGRLRRKFVRQWAFGGRWILDFYFPDERIGIEVDGVSHHSAERRRRDAQKARAREKRGIVLVRMTNAQVLFGSQKMLLDKLRAPWRGQVRNSKVSVSPRRRPRSYTAPAAAASHR